MNPSLLAENGRPKATIVIGKHPTPAAAFAARELQYHIQKISGAVPAVITDNPLAVREARKLGPLILIGDSEVTREAVGTITFEPQEYLVELIRSKKQANGPGPDVDTIVLWGDDAGLKDFKYTTVPDRVESMSGFGNACHFTEDNRPITVAGIDMDPYCGSLEAWVRPCIVPGSKGATVLRIPFQTARHILELLYVDNDVIVRYQAWDRVIGEHKHLTSGKHPAQGWHNHWHHILITYEKIVDASSLELKLFVDGAQVDHEAWEQANLGGRNLDVYIGGYVEGTNPSSRAEFRGDIDEVRISRGSRNPPNLSVPSMMKPYTADPDTMLLLHFDEPDGSVSVINDASNQSMIYEHRFPIPSIWENHGSLNAVYDFLERSCGVRWYAPAAIGEVYDKNSTLVVDVKVVRRKPAMMHRDIHTPNMTRTKTRPERQSDWYMVGPPDKPETFIPNDDRNLWLLRMRLGGTLLQSGHSLPQNCLQYLDRYPGWFGQGGEKPPKKLCYRYEPMNHPLDDQPEAVLDERIIVALCKDACNYFEGKPAILSTRNVKNCYSLVPDDGDGWCTCDECERQKGELVDKRFYFSNDQRSFSVHDLTRRIADEIMRSHPDWEGQKWLCQYAYADYAHYPRWGKYALPQNVFTWLSLHARTLWCKEVRWNDEEILNDWRQHAPGKQLGAYLYYSRPVYDTERKGFRAFPGFCASHIANLFTEDKDAGGTRYVGFKGLAGVHVEMSGENASFLIDQLELYLTFELANDPEQSGDTLTEEFFRRYYGPAAEPMRALYCAIESSFTTHYLPLASRDPTEKSTWGSDGPGSPDHMASCLKHLADAVAATADLSEAGASPTFGMSRAQPSVEEVASTGLSAQSVTSSIEQSTVFKDRADLFRRGVWGYMVEGYRNYWTNPQPADVIAAASALPILTLRIRWHVTQRELKAIMSEWQAPLELPIDLTDPFSNDELSVVTEWPHELMQMWNEYSIDTSRLVIAVIHKGPALHLPQIEIVRAAGDRFVRSIADRICAPFAMHSVKAEVIDVVSSQPLLDELLRLGLVDAARKSAPMVAEIEWSD